MIHCHHVDESGRPCSAAAIVAALGLKLSDLFPAKLTPKSPSRPSGKGYANPREAADRIAKELHLPPGSGQPYVYCDADGKTALTIYRFDLPDGGKDYRPVRFDVGSGSWMRGSIPENRPLYRLPELIEANRVLIVEGEKCVDLARSLGLVVTTSPHGAESAHKADWTPLAGKDVVILPDVGAAGEGYCRGVLKMLATLDPLPSVRILRLPDLTEDGDDIEQWIAIRSEKTSAEIRDELTCLIDAAPAVDLGKWTGEPSEGGFVSFVSDWNQPRPIRVDLRPVPPLDPRLIPGPFRGWLSDIAERASCPPDLPAMAAIVSISALIGRKVGIRPKRHDDWMVVPNLWGMGVLPPGWLKTHCLEEPKKPLARLEMEARERHEVALKEYAVSRAIAEARAEASKTALKTASKRSGVTEAELRELAEASLAEFDTKPPTLRRFLVNDATVEKLGELLGENPTGLLLYRDELMGMLRSLEKQGHENDRSFYLEAWNGNGSYTYDRIGRGSIFIASNTVSVLGGIQPGKLASYIRSTASGENDDGLISRFQLAVYPDVDQPFKNVDRYPDSEAKNRAYAVFHGLESLDLDKLGIEYSKEDSIPFVRFSDDAQSLFDEWRMELEQRVRYSNEIACLTNHLAKYRSLMPSLALIFHMIDVVDGGITGPVSKSAAARAVAWTAYLEEHARRIYQCAFDGDVEPAQRLAERIRESLPNPFTVRDVVRKGWSTLSTQEDVERAVAVLEAHDHVKFVEVPSGPEGGRPKIEIHINPRLREG